jgi:hypothetical protein
MNSLPPVELRDMQAFFSSKKLNYWKGLPLIWSGQHFGHKVLFASRCQFNSVRFKVLSSEGTVIYHQQMAGDYSPGSGQQAVSN